MSAKPRLHPIAVLAGNRAALRAALDSTALPTEVKRAAWAVLEHARRDYLARVKGVAKARAIRTAKSHALIAAHLWKVPVTAPDLVERVQKNCAIDGVVAPDARCIRKWRNQQIAQISKGQHNASARG